MIERIIEDIDNIYWQKYILIKNLFVQISTVNFFFLQVTRIEQSILRIVN